MSLDTDVDQLEAIDLSAELPCDVRACARPAEWRGRAFGCPRRHSWVYCDGHRRYVLDLLAQSRAIAGPRLTVRCGACSHPTPAPYMTWSVL